MTRVLAVAGAVITMAGVAMFLVLAAQRGWFGPGAGRRRSRAGGRRSSVSGSGAAWPTDGREAAVGSAPVALVATGAAAAYLDVVAVTSGYGWIPPVPGLVLAGRRRHRRAAPGSRWGSELLAVLLVLGAARPGPRGGPGRRLGRVGVPRMLCVVGWWAGGDRTSPAADPGSGAPGDLGPARRRRDAHVVVAPRPRAARRRRRGARGDAGHLRPSRCGGIPRRAGVGAVALLAMGLIASTVVLGPTRLARSPWPPRRPCSRRRDEPGPAPDRPLAGHLVAHGGTAGSTFAVLAVMAGAPERFVTTGLLLLALAGSPWPARARSRIYLALAAGVTHWPCSAGRSTRSPSPITGHCAFDDPRSAPPSRHGVALLDSILRRGVVAAGCGASRPAGLGREVRLGRDRVAWVLGLGASAPASSPRNPARGRGWRHRARVHDRSAVATVTWMLAATWLLLRGLERSRDADLTLRTGLVLAGMSVAKLFLYDLAALNGWCGRSPSSPSACSCSPGQPVREGLRAQPSDRMTRALAGWHSGPMDALEGAVARGLHRRGPPGRRP